MKANQLISRVRILCLLGCLCCIAVSAFAQQKSSFYNTGQGYYMGMPAYLNGRLDVTGNLGTTYTNTSAGVYSSHGLYQFGCYIYTSQGRVQLQFEGHGNPYRAEINTPGGLLLAEVWFKDMGNGQYSLEVNKRISLKHENWGEFVVTFN